MRVFLSYPPSANDRLTIRKGGKGFVNTPKYRSWKLDATWVVHMAVRGWGMIEGPYKLDIVAQPPDRRLRDLDNLLKATCDVLKSGGAIEDDSLCQVIHISWGDTKSGPGILCEVLPCQLQLSLEGGRSKSLPEIVRSQIRRLPRRAVTTQDAAIGDLLDTESRAYPVSGGRPSSIPAANIACPRPRKKPKT